MATSERDGSLPSGMQRGRKPGLLLVSSLLVLALEFRLASAEQPYNNASGYMCASAPTSCQAYAYYRIRDGNSTLNSTALLFNVSASGMSNASTGAPMMTHPMMTPLTFGSPLFVPLDCGCYNGTYQAPTTKVVTAGEYMYLIANNTFQGLSTATAIMAANPSIVPETMPIGTKLKVPLRCACPSAAQQTAGTKFLLTYAVFPDEDITSISEKFNVPAAEVMTANSLPNSTVLAFTTVLVPLKSLSVNGTTGAPASAAATGSQAHLPLLVTLLAVQSLFF